MLQTDLPDHRRASEAELVAALRRREPLALAEAYHRTIPAAHAAARRLLSGSPEVEALLREVYASLWRSPPDSEPLEGWVRARTFELAVADLRERSAAPASPSLSTILDDLPRPEVRYLDAAERALAELPDEQRRALLLAHDRGVPTWQQAEAGAESALVAALTTLAGPDPGTNGEPPTGGCDVPQLGDWVLGLLPPPRSEEVAQAVAAQPDCSGLVKALRRGRRRLEGLPPTPDMGQRVLVLVLAGGSDVATGDAGLRSALDGDDVPATATAGSADLRPVEEQDTGDLSAPPPSPAAPGGPAAQTREPTGLAASGGVVAPAAALAEAVPSAAPTGAGIPSEAARVPGEAGGGAAPAAVPAGRAAVAADASTVGAAQPTAGGAAAAPAHAAKDQRDDDLDATAAYAVAGASGPTDEGTAATVLLERDDPGGESVHRARDEPFAGDEAYDSAGGPSAARRFARGLLFALFLAAGVALGLFIGVRYLPGLLDRLS